MTTVTTTRTTRRREQSAALRHEIADSCEAYAARLRTVHVDGVSRALPSATIADLIITLERASAGLR